MMIFLNKEQSEVVKGVSKKTGISKNEVVGGIFELGMMAIITVKEGKQEVFTDTMEQELRENKKTALVAQTVHRYWRIGKNK